MVVRAPVVLMLVAVALMAGCLDDDSSTGGSSLDAIPSGAAPTGEGSGSPGEHGNHHMATSNVTVRKEGSQYVATKTITFSNDFGGASAADIKLATVTGAVTASDWSNGGYEVVATLRGSGATEQAARDNLAKLKAVHSDRLGAGRLTLDTAIQFPALSQGLGGSLVAHLPAQPAYRITGTTDTGAVAVSGLGGPSVTLEADTGALDVAGAFNTANLQTDTGAIELSGVFNVVDASTSTGAITAHVRPTVSGSIHLAADTGGIEVALDNDDGQAYDAEASVDTGSVSMSLSDADDVGAQSRTHKHVRSVGYEAAAIQVHVVLETDTGSISVRNQ